MHPNVTLSTIGIPIAARSSSRRQHVRVSQSSSRLQENVEMKPAFSPTRDPNHDRAEGVNSGGFWGPASSGNLS